MKTQNENTIIFGFDYGFIAGSNLMEAFGNLRLGQFVDLNVRDQFGANDGCEERNHRRITGHITDVECLVKGDVETVGEWLIEWNAAPLDIKKIRRRLEDRLRKSTDSEIIRTAKKFNLPLS